MSEQTTRRLKEAEEAESRQRLVVDELITELLNTVADGIADHLDAFAKKIAHEQPDITKKLGRDGVSALRRAISAAAEELGFELRQAAGAIKWPTGAFPGRKGVESV